jgi:cell division protein FtsQ
MWKRRHGSAARNSRRRSERTGRALLSPLARRRLGWAVVALGLLLLVGAALHALLDQPIERVMVTGRLQHVSPLDVERLVRAHLDGAGLVSVDLADISRGLALLPWVDSATVQRSWPRGLKIEIVEQSAVARWNGTGLVNARGQLFLSAAPFLPPELPELIGPPGSEQEVTASYLSMQGRLTEVGLHLTTLTLDARGAWSFRLDDGVTVRLGRQQMAERFGRFMDAAAKLVRARVNDITYVDMRYGNGFAIGWKGSGTRAASAPQGAPVHG